MFKIKYKLSSYTYQVLFYKFELLVLSVIKYNTFNANYYHPSRCVKYGENSPKIVAPKTKATQPNTHFARVMILPATKVVQNTKYFSNVIQVYNNSFKSS